MICFDSDFWHKRTGKRGSQRGSRGPKKSNNKVKKGLGFYGSTWPMKKKTNNSPFQYLGGCLVSICKVSGSVFKGLPWHNTHVGGKKGKQI